jgi:hypothetical protein
MLAQNDWKLVPPSWLAMTCETGSAINFETLQIQVHDLLSAQEAYAENPYW